MWRNWLWAAALTATRAKPTPRELIYDEMRRTVHQFAGASTTRESMAYARDALWPCAAHRHSTTACICVEINQCVGCTRQFFTKSFLGDDVAALVPSSGEEPASPRHRAGVASMAWRTTRRFSANAP